MVAGIPFLHCPPFPSAPTAAFSSPHPHACQPPPSGQRQSSLGLPGPWSPPSLGCPPPVSPWLSFRPHRHLDFTSPGRPSLTAAPGPRVLPLFPHHTTHSRALCLSELPVCCRGLPTRGAGGRRFLPRSQGGAQHISGRRISQNPTGAHPAFTRDRYCTGTTAAGERAKNREKQT